MKAAVSKFNWTKMIYLSGWALLLLSFPSDLGATRLEEQAERATIISAEISQALVVRGFAQNPRLSISGCQLVLEVEYDRICTNELGALRLERTDIIDMRELGLAESHSQFSPISDGTRRTFIWRLNAEITNQIRLINTQTRGNALAPLESSAPDNHPLVQRSDHVLELLDNYQVNSRTISRHCGLSALTSNLLLEQLAIAMAPGRSEAISAQLIEYQKDYCRN